MGMLEEQESNIKIAARYYAISIQWGKYSYLANGVLKRAAKRLREI